MYCLLDLLLSPGVVTTPGLRLIRRCPFKERGARLRDVTPRSRGGSGGQPSSAAQPWLAAVSSHEAVRAPAGCVPGVRKTLPLFSSAAGISGPRSGRALGPRPEERASGRRGGARAAAAGRSPAPGRERGALAAGRRAAAVPGRRREGCGGAEPESGLPRGTGVRCQLPAVLRGICVQTLSLFAITWRPRVASPRLRLQLRDAALNGIPGEVKGGQRAACGDAGGGARKRSCKEPAGNLCVLCNLGVSRIRLHQPGCASASRLCTQRTAELRRQSGTRLLFKNEEEAGSLQAI